MLVQLPNGKTTDIPLHLYIIMGDEDFQYLLSTDEGDEIGDPFYGSALRSARAETLDLVELPDIPIRERLIEIEFSEEG